MNSNTCLSFNFKYPIIINATTNNNTELTDFEVFIDNSPNKTNLQPDKKTTVDTFLFGATHTILVKKIGHEDANKTDHVIQDPENIIDLSLPRKEVTFYKNNILFNPG